MKKIFWCFFSSNKWDR